MPTTGISRRALARTRGISEAAVRAHIASGVLTEALLPDGTIDPDKADKLLAAAITRPKTGKVAPVLRHARSRRQRAQAQDLQDEVDGWWASLRNVREMASLVSLQVDGVVAPLMRRWPTQVAPTVAGKPGAEAQRALKAAVVTLLTDVHQAIGAYADNIIVADPEAPPDLTALTPVQLAAHIENLRAEKLELERWRRIGVPTVDECGVLISEAAALSKSLLMALPGRTAQLIEHADIAEAERLLAKEIEGAIAALTPDWNQLEKHP